MLKDQSEFRSNRPDEAKSRYQTPKATIRLRQSDRLKALLISSEAIEKWRKNCGCIHRAPFPDAIKTAMFIRKYLKVQSR